MCVPAPTSLRLKERESKKICFCSSAPLVKEKKKEKEEEGLFLSLCAAAAALFPSVARTQFEARESQNCRKKGARSRRGCARDGRFLKSQRQATSEQVTVQVLWLSS